VVDGSAATSGFNTAPAAAGGQGGGGGSIPAAYGTSPAVDVGPKDFEIVVADPVKQGEGVGAYVSYKVSKPSGGGVACGRVCAFDFCSPLGDLSQRHNSLQREHTQAVKRTLAVMVL
jgi:hypothetical protein